MSKNPITILLIDDHRIIRESWSAILNSDSQFQVTGSAGTGEEGIKMAMEQKPQVVLLDINMDPMNGFEVAKAIRKYAPGSKIICVSMHAIPAYAKKILQLGAVGYVTKNSSREELCTAILQVNAGNKYICDEVRVAMVHTQEETSDLPNINSLSKREIEIAKMIRTGMSSKEVAAQLDIALKTVEVHRYNILGKLHMKNTASLVNFINENNL